MYHPSADRQVDPEAPAGEVMTMGDYALAMQFDNAPTVANANQADSDHDGIGDAIDGATLAVGSVHIETAGAATLTATLLNGAGTGMPGQTVIFFIDTDGNAIEEPYSTTTAANGVATVGVTVSGGPGTAYTYRASWNGGLVTAEDHDILRIGSPLPLKIVGIACTPGVSISVTVEGLDMAATYRLARSPDLLAFSDIIVSGFKPSATTDTLIDTSPPAGKAFYRVEKE